MYRVKINYRENMNTTDIYTSLFGDFTDMYTKADGSLKTVSSFSDVPIMVIYHKSKRFLHKTVSTPINITRVTTKSIYLAIDDFVTIFSAVTELSKATGVDFKLSDIDYIKHD